MLLNQVSTRDLYTTNPGEYLRNTRFANDWEDSALLSTQAYSQNNSQQMNSQYENSQTSSSELFSQRLSQQQSNSDTSKYHLKYMSMPPLFSKDNPKTKTTRTNNVNVNYVDQLEVNKQKAKERDERDLINRIFAGVKTCVEEVKSATETIKETVDNGMTNGTERFAKLISKVNEDLFMHYKTLLEALNARDEEKQKIQQMENIIAAKDAKIDLLHSQLDECQKQQHEDVIQKLKDAYNEQQKLNREHLEILQQEKSVTLAYNEKSAAENNACNQSVRNTKCNIPVSVAMETSVPCCNGMHQSYEGWQRDEPPKYLNNVQHQDVQTVQPIKYISAYQTTSNIHQVPFNHSRNTTNIEQNQAYLKTIPSKTLNPQQHGNGEQFMENECQQVPQMNKSMVHPLHVISPHSENNRWYQAGKAKDKQSPIATVMPQVKQPSFDKTEEVIDDVPDYIVDQLEHQVGTNPTSGRKQKKFQKRRNETSEQIRRSKRISSKQRVKDHTVLPTVASRSRQNSGKRGVLLQPHLDVYSYQEDDYSTTVDKTMNIAASRKPLKRNTSLVDIVQQRKSEVKPPIKKYRRSSNFDQRMQMTEDDSENEEIELITRQAKQQKMTPTVLRLNVNNSNKSDSISHLLFKQVRRDQHNFSAKSTPAEHKLIQENKQTSNILSTANYYSDSEESSQENLFSLLMPCSPVSRNTEERESSTEDDFWISPKQNMIQDQQLEDILNKC
ncbi:uncharacterized protein LOC102809533 [Saccoglossus kowalevskii]|uniref:Interaptin-like n=1 Tax=Saccoglossus kowalevskii TaxID=10224 RepID=A0ABM0MLS2_SACKO|nr:PREDICTED: interaptin-like [Saccoglossus kowalevskii]